ncbi:alpha/beta hydrolase [Mycolicibacterium sp.]|uniref:alpha/beta fold hydrolase n=1 Tax=Mycolicibacterium sp. TaxID=2320850 RepID=UPI0028A5E3AD|nr:alpha/beta hydrolase [Mycolicibacterium sp.]
MVIPTERHIDVNGITLRVLDAGPTNGPVVVLTHGFPELAFSWRHQIPALAEAGYRVIAPDQRGYGGSSRPEAVEAYDIAALTGDVVGLLDLVGAQRAALVGHDLGAVVAWSAALLHPDRVAAVAGLSVPPVPRPQTPPTEAFRRIFGANFFYILYFQQPGVADAELATDPRRALLRILGGTRLPRAEAEALRMLAPGPEGFVDRLAEPDRLPDWLRAAELDHYVAEFARTGFTGALNWYRNFDRNWHIMGTPAVETIAIPALFIGGTDDPALKLIRSDRAREVVKGPYRHVLLDGAGHWIQQERAAEINAELLGFLAGVSW